MWGFSRTFSCLRCLNIHAWHSPRLELWSCSPSCFLINNEPHVIILQPPVQCLILYWLGCTGAQMEGGWCSPWCSPAFEVLVVVVCRSQPRGYDWHRFYVSSLFFSVKVGLCASCDGIVSCLMLFVFEARHAFFVHNCDILWEVQGSPAFIRKAAKQNPPTFTPHSFWDFIWHVFWYSNNF